jgi:hypothetical protein
MNNVLLIDVFMDLTSLMQTAELENRGPAAFIIQEFRPLRAPSGRVREFDCISGGAQLPLAPKAPHLCGAHKPYQNEMIIIKTWF